MKLRGEGGFTLLETIVGLAVMMIMVTAVTGLFISNLQTLTLSKARAIGLAVANQQMEYLRDLPYQNVATLAGAIYPPGNIADNQVVVSGGYTFNLKTEINYVDDPYDGNAAGTIPGKPVDSNTADYKKAQVSVYLKTSGALVARLTTDIAGKAAETNSNTGIVSVKVIDANGQPIANASVHIYNPVPNPDVNITYTTDNLGLVVIPNLPPDSGNNYQITASLGGYSTAQTIPDPPGAQAAVQQNLNVLVQQISAVTLSIDQISTMSLHVVDTAGNPVVNKAITITGAKKTKTNPDVYKYSVASTTDASGNINLTGMEFDSYSFAPPSGYYLVSAQPYAPAALAPNSSLSVNLVLSTSSLAPTLSAASPNTSPSGTNNVSLILTGTNLNSTTSVILRKAGSADINATGEAASNGNKTLTSTLDLTGAASGTWDIIATNAAGTIIQAGGFNVTP